MKKESIKRIFRRCRSSKPFSAFFCKVDAKKFSKLFATFFGWNKSDIFMKVSVGIASSFETNGAILNVLC